MSDKEGEIKQMFAYMQFIRVNAEACVSFIETWAKAYKLVVLFPALEMSDTPKIKILTENGWVVTVNEWDYLVVDKEKNLSIYSPEEFERL